LTQAIQSRVRCCNSVPGAPSLPSVTMSAPEHSPSPVIGLPTNPSPHLRSRAHLSGLSSSAASTASLTQPLSLTDPITPITAHSPPTTLSPTSTTSPTTLCNRCHTLLCPSASPPPHPTPSTDPLHITVPSR